MDHICKQTAPRSIQITTPTPHHSIFYRPEALPDAKPAVSNHESTTNRSKRRYWVTADRPTCGKLYAGVQPRRVDRCWCRQQARPSTSFVDNTINRPAVEKFSTTVWDKVSVGSSLIFGSTRISLLHSVGQVKGSFRAKQPTRSVNWSRCNTGL